MRLLFIIHYLNHIHYLVRKCLAQITSQLTQFRCRGIKHIFFRFYARWQLFRSFEFWALLLYPQKCRESSIKMQEIAFQRPHISKFSWQEHAARPPREFLRLQCSNIFTPCFIIYGLTTTFTFKLRGLLTAHQYLSNVQKAAKTVWNHGLKTTRRYAHCCRHFGNFQMMSNKWQLIIADAVNHVSKASLLESVHTLCKRCK